MKKDMHSRLATLCLFVCTIFFLVTVFACLAYAAEFSADMIQTLPNHTIKGKVFVKGENIRQEIISKRGHHPIIIFRKDKNVILTLMPQNRMYMEMANTEKGRILTEMDKDEIEHAAKKEYLGEERINGYLCKKYRFVFNDKNRGTTTQWISEKLNFPIKIVSQSEGGKVVLEYKNIKEGNIPDSLFNVPPGYKKMSMPFMPGMKKGMNRCPFQGKRGMMGR